MSLKFANVVLASFLVFHVSLAGTGTPRGEKISWEKVKVPIVKWLEEQDFEYNDLLLPTMDETNSGWIYSSKYMVVKSPWVGSHRYSFKIKTEGDRIEIEKVAVDSISY